MSHAIARSVAADILAEMSDDDRSSFDPATWRSDIAYQLADFGVDEDLDEVLEEIAELIEEEG